MKAVRVQVPATTANLGPGFDALGLALSLHNEIELSLAEDIHIEIAGEGADKLPRDETHLVLHSATRLARQYGHEIAGFHLRQCNRIPLARGLGSSSAAIVAGLVAANELLALGLSAEELVPLAAEIEGHPDNVTPALLGGLTVCCANGQLSYLKLPPPDLKVVVAVPDFEISTEAARKVLPSEIPHRDGVHNVAHVAMTLGALVAGRYELLRESMEDKLHEPYRAHLVPGFPCVKKAALAAGAYGVCLSGSGPTIAAFVGQNEEEIAASMCAAFLEAGVQARTLILKPEKKGATVLQG